MNYAEIKEKYPKAFAAFITKEYHSIPFSIETINPLNTQEFEQIYIDSLGVERTRVLYDFFDAQSIYIGIFRVSLTWMFGCEIITGETQAKLNADFVGENNYRERKDAEIVAFTKAFELLEEQL